MKGLKCCSQDFLRRCCVQFGGVGQEEGATRVLQGKTPGFYTKDSNGNGSRSTQRIQGDSRRISLPF